MRPAILTLLLATATLAQLTPDQRETDFRALAGFVSRYYAPLEWKRLVHGVDGLATEPWVARVRGARNDIDFQKICVEYMSQFRDGHMGFLPASFLVADAGMLADLFDGKLLLYAVNRVRYPAARFPGLAPGNEVVSLDGRPAMEIVNELAKANPNGSGRANDRLAALFLFSRPQYYFVDAIDLPETSTVVVRNPAGEEASYTISWEKSGFGAKVIPPSVSEAPPPGPLAPPMLEGSLRPGLRIPLMREGEPSIRFQGESPLPVQGVSGLGQRVPYYALPAGFTVRRGRLTSDTFFTGTYNSDGQRIGLIRIPNFQPANIAAAIAELSTEITYMKENTDGLVIDVSRNTGGFFAVLMAYYARFTTRPWFFTPFQILPSTSDAVSYHSLAEQVAALSREQWVITKWNGVARELRTAWEAGNRQLTGPVSFITEAGFGSLTRGPLTDDNFPWLDAARQPIGYDKPIITLVDDLTGSAGDTFAAVVQDNRRGPLVGMRTWGLGGYVLSFSQAMPYSQADITLTGGLSVRRNPVRVPGLPEAPYIEDLGVVPDIVLDYQTRNNLMTQGRDYVTAFTRIMVEEIRRAR